MSITRRFLFCFICASTLPGVGVSAETPLGPPTQDLLAIEATARTHHSDDCVILFRGVEVVLDPDGRVSRRIRQVERLLTDAAIAHRGDRRVAFDTTRQELAVSVCRAFMQDGTEVPALPRAFNRTTPDRVSRCPDRAGLQEIVISFLGVERGCLVELDYAIKDRASWLPWLEGAEGIGDEAPVMACEVGITVPSGATFHWAAAGGGVDAGTAPRIEGNRRSWRFTEIPAYPYEGGLSDLERRPHLLYSTCQGWGSLAGWIRGRVMDAAIPDEAIESWTRGPMPSGRPPLGDKDRLATASWLLRERMNAADDPTLDWQLPARPASRTFATSCGNMLDRAALAVAALQALGLKTDLVLRPAVPRVIREVPALLQFDEIWLERGAHRLAVREGISGPAIDPGAAEEVLACAGEAATFRNLGDRRSRGRLSLRLRQDEDGGVAGEAVLDMKGAICRFASHEDLKGFLDGFASGLAEGAEVAGYRVDALGPDTLSLLFSFTGGSLGDSIGPRARMLPIPSLPGMPEAILPEGVSLSRTERDTPLRLPFLIEEEIDLRVDLPPATRPTILPAAGRFEGGGCLVETEVDAEPKSVRIRRKLVVAEPVISPERWPDFRAVLLRRFERDANGLWLAGSGAHR
ncbi:MAG: DUF3857 domain-containing protein [Candidatus Eisenbacteria bacterium]|nr:DUF3857 domain-containing protein [Candidatus Eisenbacteria bacterium]